MLLDERDGLEREWPVAQSSAGGLRLQAALAAVACDRMVRVPRMAIARARYLVFLRREG